MGNEQGDEGRSVPTEMYIVYSTLVQAPWSLKNREIRSPYMVDHKVHATSRFAYNRRVVVTNLQTYREAAEAGAEWRKEFSPRRQIDFVRIVL